MKLCTRVKDTLMCSEGGKPCNNKDCAIVKMGYKAEDFEDTPTQQKIKDILSSMTQAAPILSQPKRASQLPATKAV